MTVTVVAVLCHMLNGAPLCHEEIVHVGDSMQECILFPPAIADWKRHSRFADDQEWTITRVGCVLGTYVNRDAI